MDTIAQNEQKQMEKLEEMRNVFQVILTSHLGLLAATFLAVLAGFLVMFYIKAKTSSSRYVGEVKLHYQPKNTKNVAPFDNAYVMHVLSRETVRRQFIESLYYREEANQEDGPQDIKIENSIRESDYFTLSVAASTEKDAVSYVNILADICTGAYIQERRNSLENLRGVLAQKKQDFSQQMAKVNQDLDELNFTLVMVAPERNYEHLQNRLGGEEASLARQRANVASLESQRKFLEENKAVTMPQLLPNIGLINSYMDELKQLDAEIKRVKETYTDQNPKVVVRERHRANTEQEFHDFLDAKGLTMDDLEFMESAPEVIKELDRVNMQLASAKESLSLQEQVVNALRHDLETFNEKYPKRQYLNHELDKLSDAVGNLDATTADIDYLEPFVAGELFVGEIARTAKENLPFTKETLSMSFLGSVMIAGILAFFLLVTEYNFGKVSSEKELEGLSYARYLGIQPTENSKFSTHSPERSFFSGISHQFNATTPMPKAVLLSSLPGGELRPEFVQAFAEDCALDERKVLVLQLVPAKNYKIPAERDLHRGAITLYTGSQGVVPVGDTNFLMPREEEKLRQDVIILAKKYDLVCVVQPVPLMQNGVFLEQAATFCKAAILVVGNKRTPRSAVRKLHGLKEKAHLTFMTILSGRIKTN